MTKEEVIKMLVKRGWSYKIDSDKNGEVISYAFSQIDKNDLDATWNVWIEDHHNDIDVDDWVIYSGYFAPHNKDWFGDISNTMGAIHYEDMKIFCHFIQILESKRCD